MPGPGGSIGEAFIDITLRTKQLDRDLKEVKAKTERAVVEVRSKWDMLSSSALRENLTVYGVPLLALRTGLGVVASTLRAGQAAAAAFSGDLKETDKALESLGFGFGSVYAAGRDFIREITGARWSDEFKAQADQVLQSLNDIGLAMYRGARRATEDIGGKPSESTSILRQAEDDANKFKVIWETAYNELHAKKPTAPKFEFLNAAIKFLYGGQTTYQRTLGEWSAAEQAMRTDRDRYSGDLKTRADAMIARAETEAAEKLAKEEAAAYAKTQEEKWRTFERFMDMREQAIEQLARKEQEISRAALTWRGAVSRFGPPLSTAPAIAETPPAGQDSQAISALKRQWAVFGDIFTRAPGMLLLGAKMTGG